METDNKRINSFKGISTDVGNAKRAWHDAENQVRRLAVGISSTAEPTKAMQAEFDKSKIAAGRAKDAYLRKREALNKVRTEMVAAGQTSIGLAAQQIKLSGSIDRLKLKYTALDSVIGKHKAVLAKRTELRAQIFDTIALGAAMIAPMRSAAKFETAMFDVKETLRDLPEKDATKVVNQLGASIKNLTRTLPFTADQLAIMAATGGRLGIATANLGEFIEVTAKMATVFDMTAEDASDSIAKISKAFNIPLNQISNLSDAINQLSDTSQVEAGDIFKAMAKSGGAAIGFGLAADKTAALASSFIVLGKEPRAASSAINDLLLKLGNADKQSDKFKEGLSALGFETSVFQEAVKKDAAGALLSFLQAANEAENGSSLLFDMFGGSADDISLLVERLDVYKSALGTLKNESGRAGATEREFAAKMATSEQRMKLFNNTISTLGINIGSLLLPALNSVLTGFSTVIGIVADATTRFPMLAKAILIPVFGLIALKVASSALAYSWTFVSGGALLVRRALLAIGIEATLAGLKFQTFNAISFITSLRLKALAIGQSLVALWGVLGNAVSFASARLLTFNAVSLVTAVRIRTFAIGSMIKSFAVGLISMAGTAIPIVIGALRALTIALISNPIGLIIGGVALAAGLVIGNWEKVKTFFTSIWEPIKPVWEEFANWIGNFWKIISAPFNAIGKVFEFLFGSKSLKADIEGIPQTASPLGKDNTPLTEDATDGINGSTTFANLPQQSFVNPVTPNQKTTESKTINNNFKIEINAAPGQDIKSIAEEVMRKIKEMSRGALFDTAGATL
jgi:TP901 family phage tail tape measure protein